MTTKLKIDLSQGLLEVEGSESFVRTIYSDFKTHFAGIDDDDETTASKRTRRTRKTKTTSNKTTPAAKKSTTTTATAEKVTPPKAAKKAEVLSKPPLPKPPAYTYIDGLALEATDGHPSLVEFMDTKFPITNEERNIVFIYFLHHMLNLDMVTPDHIYTCYRAVKFRAPLNIENTLTRRDWIEVDKDNNLSLTEAGKNYVENQLPKKVK